MESPKGGLGDAFDPEGTSGIPLCSGPRGSAVVETIDHGSGGLDAVTTGKHASLGMHVECTLQLISDTTVVIPGLGHDDGSFRLKIRGAISRNR